MRMAAEDGLHNSGSKPGEIVGKLGSSFGRNERRLMLHSLRNSIDILTFGLYEWIIEAASFFNRLRREGYFRSGATSNDRRIALYRVRQQYDEDHAPQTKSQTNN